MPFVHASCNTFSVRSFVNNIFSIGLESWQKNTKKTKQINWIRVFGFNKNEQFVCVFTLECTVRWAIQHCPSFQPTILVQIVPIFRRLSIDVSMKMTTTTTFYANSMNNNWRVKLKIDRQVGSTLSLCKYKNRTKRCWGYAHIVRTL